MEDAIAALQEDDDIRNVVASSPVRPRVARWNPVSPGNSAASSSAIAHSARVRKETRCDIFSMEAIERATREGRATTGDDLRTAAQTEGFETLLLELPTYAVAAFLGGQKVKDGPFCPIPTEELEKMDPERVFIQLECIGNSPTWSKKKVRAMRSEFINYRSWCEDCDVWMTGRTSVLIASEYLQDWHDTSVAKYALKDGDQDGASG